MNLLKKCGIVGLCAGLILMGCGCHRSSTATGTNESETQAALIDAYAPAGDETHESLDELTVYVVPVDDTMTATATLGEETVELTPIEQSQFVDNEEIARRLLAGSFTLPVVEEETVLGKVVFTCLKDEVTETYESGTITVLPKPAEPPRTDTRIVTGEAVTQPGGGTTAAKVPDRSDVPLKSTSYVATITSDYAETFWGNTTDDCSRPTEAYLPAGTVDYCAPAEIYNKSVGKSYRLLGYGNRVYTKDISVSEGTLPDHNELLFQGVTRRDKYTELVFTPLWNAPFRLELTGQSYYNETRQDYRVDQVTFDTVKITFCYCTQFSGEVLFEDNPLFQKATITQHENECIMTLTLNNPGGFYGYSAAYRDDELVFSFLEPTKLYTADNEYGYALYDATIVIDPGHGGIDGGAVAKNGTTEAACNLMLARILQEELTKIGAHVVLLRTDDTNISGAQRTAAARAAHPDLMISLHRDSGRDNGFCAYYFDPFSVPLQQAVTQATQEAGVYRTVKSNSWHYFFLNRVSDCPSLLTENGFMSDSTDLAAMDDEDHERACAKAMVQGIVDYCLARPR